MSIDNNNNDDRKADSDSRHHENIFELMDGIIDQLNNTKRLFIAMILTVMIIPPLVFIITFELIASSNPTSSPPPVDIGHHKGEHRGGGLLGANPLFTITRDVPLIIGIIWLGVGIRQWIVLSKWNKKYQRYKELQKKIEEKMDDEDNSYSNN